MRKIAIVLGLSVLLAVISVAVFWGVQRQREISQFKFLVKQDKALVNVKQKIFLLPKQAEKKKKIAQKKFDEILQRIGISGPQPEIPEAEEDVIVWMEDEKESLELDSHSDATPDQEKEFEKLKSQLEHLYFGPDKWLEAELEKAKTKALLTKSRLSDKYVSRDLWPLKRNLILMADFLYRLAALSLAREKDDSQNVQITEVDIDEYQTASTRVEEETQRFVKKWGLNPKDFIVEP